MSKKCETREQFDKEREYWIARFEREPLSWQSKEFGEWATANFEWLAQVMREKRAAEPSLDYPWSSVRQ